MRTRGGSITDAYRFDIQVGVVGAKNERCHETYS